MKILSDFLRLSSRRSQYTNTKFEEITFSVLYGGAGCTYRQDLTIVMDHSIIRFFLVFSCQISVKALSLSSSVPYCVLSGRLDANTIKGSWWRNRIAQNFDNTIALHPSCQYFRPDLSNLHRFSASKAQKRGKSHIHLSHICGLKWSMVDLVSAMVWCSHLYCFACIIP